MIVVDTSAVVSLLVAEPFDDDLASRLVSEGVLHAPHLVDVEVVSALRGMVMGDDLTARRASAALDDFRDLRIRRHPHTPLLDAIWHRRAFLGAYDASFVALADALDAVLVTCDEALARALEQDAVVVEVFTGSASS